MAPYWQQMEGNINSNRRQDRIPTQKQVQAASQKGTTLAQELQPQSQRAQRHDRPSNHRAAPETDPTRLR